jgi:AmmeMemoRadiSam system protein A
MGSLQVTEPLVVNVARNAQLAAFEDPRFSPLLLEEFPRLEIHLSILSPAEPLMFESEAELLALMRPGIDGLTLSEGSRRATLLPAVWKSIADPNEFLVQLKRKAGLPAVYWSPTLRVERYTAESVGEDL